MSEGKNWRTVLDIDDEIRELWELAPVDEETGEILVDLTKLEALEMEKERKVEGGLMVFKESRYREEALRKEIENLKGRVKYEQRLQEKIKDWSQYATGGKKFSTTRASVSFRKTQSVEVTNVDILPEEYRRVKTTIDADKIALKEALKEGEIIDGARLVNGTAVIIK